jgi:putative integral membrane protein (TIGR02587 family)
VVTAHPNDPASVHAVPAAATESPWATEVIDLARGASGGFLFGIPLLYTMEIWWVGSHTTAFQAIGILAAGSIPVYLLNQTSGFRSSSAVRVRDAVADTIEAMALAVVLVAIVLVLLRQVTATTPIDVAFAKIAYEALPFAIGIAVANHFLNAGRDAGDGDDDGKGDGDGDGAGDREDDDGAEPDRSINATLADLGATAVGAVFVALNISPTDEVPMIASAMGRAWTIALVVASLAVSYVIVFGAGFARQAQRHSQVGLFQHPTTETVASYLVALACAALMLAVFQRHQGTWALSLQHVVVLGFPAAIGGAAGRLAI